MKPSMRFSIRHRASLGFALALMVTAAQAHMPYLLPSTFDATGRNQVTVTASFTEAPFTPDVAMKSDRYAVLLPGGALQAITDVHYLKDLAAFDVTLPENGIYRVSSGERLGRKAKMWKQPNGSWKFVDEKDAAPQGVTLVEVQSVTKAEAYVVRGKANARALTPEGKGLEIALQTPPQDIVARQPAQATLLYQGRPLPDVVVEIYKGTVDGGEHSKPTLSVRSDAQGRLQWTPTAPGTYLAMVRHRAEAPAGSETAWRSHTYALTFSVAE